MQCADARERLLEAELVDLQPGDHSELARHLRDCAACRTLAQRIQREESALAAQLAAVRPRRSIDDALEAARASHVGRARQRWWWAAVPLAAAAALMAILWDGTGTDANRPSPPAVLAEAPRVDVVPPAGRSVAVFETDNPNITVIWFF